MNQIIADVVNLKQYPLENIEFRAQCKRTLDENGVLVMPNFLKSSAVESIRIEGEQSQHLAYYTVDDHNIYLKENDPNFPPDHARNRQVSSSKGCITTDQIPTNSALHTLYDASDFREFLCAVLAETELHEYADAMSSINLHYADEGQELGWHFDNSSFAITLMIQNPKDGGEFEYVKDVRDADSGAMNYELSVKVLAYNTQPGISLSESARMTFYGRLL